MIVLYGVILQENTNEYLFLKFHISTMTYRVCWDRNPNNKKSIFGGYYHSFYNMASRLLIMWLIFGALPSNSFGPPFSPVAATGATDTREVTAWRSLTKRWLSPRHCYTEKMTAATMIAVWGQRRHKDGVPFPVSGVEITTGNAGFPKGSELQARWPADFSWYFFPIRMSKKRPASKFRYGDGDYRSAAVMFHTMAALGLGRLKITRESYLPSL